MAYRQKLDFDRAIVDYGAALRLVHDVHDKSLVYRFRGYCYAAMGELALANAEFNSAIETDSTSAEAHQVRGVTREMMGDAEGAAEDFRLAKELGYED